MKFEEAWKYTKTISQESGFYKEEGSAFFDALMQLPKGSTVIEVGCEHGRSTSLIAQAAKERGYTVILVDPFVDFIDRAYRSCTGMLRDIGIPFTLHCMKLADVPGWGLPEADFIHIDGDHSEEGVTQDCERILPLVKREGYACFHDYIHHRHPYIKGIVDSYTMNPGWEEVGTFARLRIVKKSPHIVFIGKRKT